MPIKAEYGRVNLWHVLAAFAGALITVGANAYFVGGQVAEVKASIAAAQSDISDLQKSQADEVAARIERSKQTDQDFQKINDKLPQFEVVNQQILRLAEQTAENRKMIEATNDRLDRRDQVQSDKLDKLIDAVADLRGDMKTVQSQLSDPNRINNRSRVPTDFRMR